MGGAAITSVALCRLAPIAEIPSYRNRVTGDIDHLRFTTLSKAERIFVFESFMPAKGFKVTGER